MDEQKKVVEEKIARTKSGGGMLILGLFLRQHRTTIVVQMRSQIFRQIVLKRRRNTVVFQGVSVQYDGKSASRCAAKAVAGGCAVLP